MVYFLFCSNLSNGHDSGFVPEQPEYECFENDPIPVDTKESFNNHCLDYDGNIHNENATVTTCCECLRFTCQYLGSLGSVDLFYWNKTVSESCCLHCDGKVYKADEVIETVVEDDDCKSVKTSVCRKNDLEVASIEVDFTYRNCCNDEEGFLQSLGTVKFEPSTCSKRTCEFFSMYLHTSWTSAQVFFMNLEVIFSLAINKIVRLKKPQCGYLSVM